MNSIITTFIHSVIASAIISVALVWIINPDNPEPWYKRLKRFWVFLTYWKQNPILYLGLWIFILSSLILILYWVMEGILRII